jgi:hypothetical protein
LGLIRVGIAMNIETTDLKAADILQFMPLKDQYIYYGVTNGINGGYQQSKNLNQKIIL